MGQGSGRREPSDDERTLAWDRWLDGHSVGSIHRFDLYTLPLAAVRRILAEEPPEGIKADLRHRLGGRFFWMAASGIVNPLTGKQDSLVVVQSPRAYPRSALHGAIRAIRRDVRSDGGEVDYGVVEGFEADAAVRMVNVRGFRFYRFDETGAVERLERIDVSEPEEAPGPACP